MRGSRHVCSLEQKPFSSIVVPILHSDFPDINDSASLGEYILEEKSAAHSLSHLFVIGHQIKVVPEHIGLTI